MNEEPTIDEGIVIFGKNPNTVWEMANITNREEEEINQTVIKYLNNEIDLRTDFSKLSSYNIEVLNKLIDERVIKCLKDIGFEKIPDNYSINIENS